MPRLPLLGAALSACLVPVAAQNQCFERYQCIFHHDVNGVEYSWDLHQLCRSPGQEYSFTDANNHTYSVNVCGNTTTLCAPQGWNVYSTIGVAVQTWSAPPTPCDNSCTNSDTGASMCCTGNCAVLGTEFFQFSLINNNDPLRGGVQLQHVGMPPDVEDPFNCPADNVTNLARERQITIKLYCDPKAPKTSISNIRVTESAAIPCQYVLEASTAAACGVVGDPFDFPPVDTPAIQFGYTVLGATLAGVVYFFCVFADGRGWFDPIKSRMPSIPFLSRGGGAGYSSGGSSSYRSISTATPISASAYGST